MTTPCYHVWIVSLRLPGFASIATVRNTKMALPFLPGNSFTQNVSYFFKFSVVENVVYANSLEGISSTNLIRLITTETFITSLASTNQG